jgi:DNA-binding NtrC family response regulator
MQWDTHMQRSTKVLIIDETSYAPEFVLKLMAHRGYRAIFAKGAVEITDMLSNDQYDIVLTNGNYQSFGLDHDTRANVSVFSICIEDSHNQTQDFSVDMYLSRPFLSSKLWRALETQLQLRKD